MMRWLSIRLYKEYNVWHWHDNKGMGKGHAKKRLGALCLAIRGKRGWYA